jgi:alginate O-acetyltransferase complex protein AlgI
LVDYTIGLQLYKAKKERKRKVLLWTSILVNLGFLGFFKYYNFFVDNFVQAFRWFGQEIQPNSLDIILPVGISFYTFQTLSYTIDVYRKKLEPTKDILAFAAFVSFFPQLVAGPIERATNLLPQFYTPRRFKFVNIQFGFIRILWGLFKKVVIADRVALLVNTVYNDPGAHGGLHYALATVLFAFQIYCDFSGYSDIAIGTARLFDFKLMENFRSPYFSRSLGEFWRRWHISLSTWFRDYVYIPLGGNRVSKGRLRINLLIVFIVSGFWHGAKWTFIIWGALHGLILIMENLLKVHKHRFIKGQFKALDYVHILFTFFITCIAWIFFRANNVNEAFEMVTGLLDISQPLATTFRGRTLYLGAPLWEFVACYVLIILLLTIESFIIKRKLSEMQLIKRPLPVRWAVLMILILGILIFGSFEVNEFIYFQF